MYNKHIKMIDDVLNYLYDTRNFETPENSYQSIKGVLMIQSELKKLNVLLDVSDIENTLRKLKKENFVDLKITKEGLENYYISFEGKILKESGGYKDKINRENAEIKKLSDLTNNVEERDNKLFWLTVVLTVGTSIAALYYLNELCWKYHWFSFCHCH